MVIVQVEKNDNYAKIKNLHNKKIRQKKSVIPLVVGPRYIFYAHSLCPEAVLRCANDDTPPYFALLCTTVLLLCTKRLGLL